ncbi:MAG: hypothetical protein ABSH40_07930 [Bryobacteraceae bacterium]|jgi:hypothetical protein
MPAYSGKFQYLDESGAALQQGPCQLSFDAETCTVAPASGTPIAFDLGDVEQATPGEWDFQLALYTGKRIGLAQFGPAFGRMSEELLAAWRDRTVHCLLLEDLEEIARYTGTAAGGAAEIRLYASNLAVLPLAAPPLQWRLAEVDSVEFDEAAYTIRLSAAGGSLAIGKLAKKTDEFRQKLQSALDALHTRSAEALHITFPFLNPDQLQRLLPAMPEGRSVKLPALAAIHPKLPEALVAGVVDAPLRPYFDALRTRSAAGSLMTGFKFIRPDEEKPEAGPEDGTPGEKQDEQGAPAGSQPAPLDRPPLFFWFFFPMAAGGLVAWEATTGTGRATYFFRVAEPVEPAIARLTRGLALVNFRREPVYLPDDSLDRQQRYHRYAIGCRKLPDLRWLRAAFVGRALHTNVEAWQAQVDGMR